MKVGELHWPRGMTVYVDMDGVLADFEAGYHTLFGKMPGSESRDDPNIAKLVGTNFFGTLPKYDSADALIQLVLDHAGRYNICTAPLRGDHKNSGHWKREWLAQHITPAPQQVKVNGQKEVYAVGADGVPNVLIDDKPKNIQRWRAAGGIGIEYLASRDGLDVVAQGLRQASQWRPDTVQESATGDLEKDLRDPLGYSAIDHMMQTISRKHSITPERLHDLFVSKHGCTPDDWIRKGMTEAVSVASNNTGTTEHFNGIDIYMEVRKPDYEVFVQALANGRELGYVLFAFDLDEEFLVPQDLEVNERFQGQGIAQTMYDYVKSKGYKIRRSTYQTDAGAGFWKKHRPQQNVWEGNDSDVMRYHEIMAEYKKYPTQEYEGVTFTMVEKDGQLIVKALNDFGIAMGYVRFNMDGKELDPKDLKVEEKYQGQGIARVMYDYIKSRGFVINRSFDQTYAGRGFWDKHRPQQNVWEQGVTEGRLNESAIFLNPNTVIVGQEHGKPLKLSPEISKQVQAIAKKHGAWYEGNGMDRKFTKGIIDDYQGSWDDDLLSPSIKGYPYPFLYVLFSNIKANDTVKGKIGSDPKVTIFDRILNTQPSTNYFPDRTFSSEDLTKFLKSVSQGKYDFVKMSQAPATEKNVQKFFKIGEKLMWPENWEEYPNRAGQLAKRVNDLRDKFLASRKSGVYVVGRGHLIAVRNLVKKQSVAEGLRVDVPNEGWLQGKIDYARDKGRNSWGVPYMGTTTAYTTENVPVSVDILKRLPGQRGEQTNVRQQDLAAIMKIMKDTGQLPLDDRGREYAPYVTVAYNGEAWVNEGNHRIMAAAALGWPELPVQISYFDGGERVKSGAMYPGRIGLGDIKENFADGKGPGRPGDSRRHGIKKGVTLAQLDRIVHSKTASPRKKQLAHWQANMRRGKAKK